MTLCLSTTTGIEVKLHSSLTSALDASKRAALSFGAFIPGDRDPGIRWMGGWLEHKVCMERGGEEKISAPAGNRKPVVQPVISDFTKWTVYELGGGRVGSSTGIPATFCDVLVWRPLQVSSHTRDALNHSSCARVFRCNQNQPKRLLKSLCLSLLTWKSSKTDKLILMKLRK
jgi:hypothetical protein